MAKLMLAAVGDISFGGPVGPLVQQHGPDWIFEHVRETLQAADVRFGNIESVMLPAEFPEDKIRPRAVCSGDHVAESLRRIGFDVLHQANNHALDCGSIGLEHTYQKVIETGAQALGAGPTADEAQALHVVEKNGVRLGFLGWQETCNWTLQGGGGRLAYFDLSRAVEQIKESLPGVDVLVASLHADMEFSDGPSLLKVKWCRALAEAGAQVVLCHHPHVPQGIERWADALIAYSLGNFVFRISDYFTRWSNHTDKAQVLLMEIEDGKVADFRREYFRIDHQTGRAAPIGFLKRRADVKHSDRLDAIVADEAKLRQTWHESCLHYLKINWDELTHTSPEKFIEQYGWRLLGLTEHAHWTQGLYEMAQAHYEQRKAGDFEHHRPNTPFEEKS